MKRILILIALVLFTLPGMAQDAPKKDKTMEALITDAISRGMRADGTYILDNQKNKNVEPSSAKTYLHAKGYIISGSSTKTYMKFGNPIQVVDKIVFFDSKNYNLFAFHRLKGNKNILYSQLNKQGTFIFDDKEFLKNSRGIELGKKIGGDTYLCKDVHWSGPLVNGLLDGHGVGFISFGDVYCFFEGDFKCGFPVSGLNMKTMKKDDWSIRETNQYSTYKYIIKQEKIADWSATWKNPPAEVQTALLEYAKCDYEKYAKQIEQDYDNLLPINNNINHTYTSSIAEYFIKQYRPLNYDPKGVLPKATEICDLQTVRAALAIDLQKKYIYHHLILGLQFEMTAALKDTALMGHAIRIASSKSLIIEQNPFGDYYRKVIDDLYFTNDKMYDNINSQIREYNGKLLEKKQYEAEMCEKCKIIGSKTIMPTGYMEENTSWFFGHPAQSEESGKIVLATGEEITWKYLYPGSNRTKRTVEASWDPFWYEKEFDSEEELMNAIVKKCKELWCH